MSEWIKCSERMPDKFEWVLVLARIENLTPKVVARLDKHGDWDVLGMGEFPAGYSVTHWMHLPTTPED